MIDRTAKGTMLSRWLDRGLGQIIAPDDRIASAEQPPEASSDFWSTVAPDPVWEASQHGPNKQKSPNAKVLNRSSSSAPPPAAFLYSPNQQKKMLPTEVVCIHCGGITPVAPAKTPTNSSSTLQVPSLFGADAGGSKDVVDEEDDVELNKLVLKAAKETAASSSAPRDVADQRNKVLRLCASTKPLDKKMTNRLKKLLNNDRSLLKERSSHLGTLVPDGYTPLMAAASVNNMDAARVIIELDNSTRRDVDLQGRTALHIAGETGSLDVSRMLMEDGEAPVDLTGKTPLGRAVTSVHKSARRNQSQLQQVLFSPGDKSVCGRPSPYPKRQAGVVNLYAQFGHASMPGFRVLMEDAVACDVLPNGKTLLVSVCDGHGDNGKVSSFLTKKAPAILENKLQQEENMNDPEACWTETCQELEETLKHTGLGGGSTALWASVDEKHIVVANVGDCRCILVQTAPVEKKDGEDEKALTDAMSKVQIGEEETKDDTVKDASDQQEGEATTEGKPKAAQQPQEEEPPKPAFVVKPLSEDHKPNLPDEKARIEKAGLSVSKETYYDEKAMRQTIYKIDLTDTDRMAVSRSFGDFEYKSNTTLTAPEQAVVSIPEVEIHERDADRDLYLILACDGVWDVMDSQEVASFVYEKAQASAQADEPDVLPRVGDMLLQACLDKGSKDNMSVVIVALNNASASVEKSGALERRALKF